MTATTTTETMLLRAVLETPYDDSPRLVLADWHEENGQADRAEFIRCQIEHSSIPIHECDRIYPGCTVDMSGPYVYHNHKCRGYQPQQRYIEIWDEHGKEWFGETKGKIDVVRGFPQAIKVTSGEWIGGPCRKCYIRRDGNETIRDGCNHCNWTGRVEGIARQVCERWPVTTVRLAGKSPVEDYWSYLQGDEQYANVIPECLFKMLKGRIISDTINGIPRKCFRSREEALDSLSLAAVQYGRSLAGLPPLGH